MPLCGSGGGSPPADLVGIGAQCERAGLDGFFVAPSPGWDPYVLLGAVAATTCRVVLGCLAARPDERAPSMLAKVVSGLDVCSAGRAVLGLDATPRRETPEDHAGETSELDGLGEALEVCRAMIREEAPSLSIGGSAIAGAWNEPRLADLPVAVLVPFAGRRRSLVAAGIELAARFAEICVVDVGATGAGRLWDRRPGSPGGGESAGEWIRSRLDGACLAAGRAPGEVRLLVICAEQGGVGDRGVRARAREWLASVADGIVVDLDPSLLAGGRGEALLEAIGSLPG